jgi:hypothetical protein
MADHKDGTPGLRKNPGCASFPTKVLCPCCWRDMAEEALDDADTYLGEIERLTQCRDAAQIRDIVRAALIQTSRVTWRIQ